MFRLTMFNSQGTLQQEATQAEQPIAVQQPLQALQQQQVAMMTDGMSSLFFSIGTNQALEILQQDTGNTSQEESVDQTQVQRRRIHLPGLPAGEDTFEDIKAKSTVEASEVASETSPSVRILILDY